MQSYSNPDVFFCPLYNPPGVSDPISTILAGESEHWVPSTPSTPTSSRSASPFSALASPQSTPPTSRENSVSPPSSPSPSKSALTTATAREPSKKLQRFRRMCAKSSMGLLDFATEVEGRRIMHEKRKHLQASQSSRNPPMRTIYSSARC